jgi:aromatic ring-cleaving dioxygenase
VNFIFKVKEMISIYLEYKNSTDQFLKWILKNSTLQDTASTVNVWPAHAKNIVSNAANLLKKESFVAELNRALYHVRQAIASRTRVHLLHVQPKPVCVSEKDYESFVLDNEKHAYIIHCLQDCYSVLKVLVPVPEERAEMKETLNKATGSDQPETIFQSFSLDSDDVDTTDFANLNIKVEEPIRLGDIDLQFGDIHLRFLCFFLDLIQLEEKVIQVWKRVKQLEISLVSATVVTHFAIQKIKTIDSELSLIYPTHSNASTFLYALKGFLSPMEYDWVSNHSTFHLLTTILECYQQCSEELATCFNNCKRVIREKQMPEYAYHKEFRPLSDNQADVKQFLECEVRVLFNALVGLKKEDDSEENLCDRFNLDPGHPTWSVYIREFISFFETANVSTTFLFLTLCWIRSVQCLENSNELFLYKTVYLYRSFVRQRHTNFKIHLRTYDSIIRFYGDSRGNLFEEFRSRRMYYVNPHRCINQQGLYSWNIYRHHPYLVGMFFLEEVFSDHYKCGELLCDRLGFSLTFPLIYRSLQETGMMSDTIPFFEEFYDFMENSYQIRHSLATDNSKQYLVFTIIYLLNYGKKHGDWVQPQWYVLPKSIEQMLWHPYDVSVLFSVLCNDDFSDLKADSVFSEEGMEELIQIAEKEVLNGGYLSVDLFKYFIAFRGFLVFLESGKSTSADDKPSPLKEWYDRDCPNRETNFFAWIEQKFFPFLGRFFSSPFGKRPPKDLAMVNYFMNAMVCFYKDNMRDQDILGERTFIIPKQMNWQTIYETHFGQSFTIGLKSVFASALENYHTEIVINSYKNFLCTFCRGFAEFETSMMRFGINVRVENIVRKNLVTIIAGEISPECVAESFFRNVVLFFCTEELFEFMFVSYGCCLFCLYPHWNSEILLNLCENYRPCALDVLVGVSSPERMRVTYEETRDSVFHLLAKANHYNMIYELIGYGHLPIATDSSGNRLPFCLNKERRLYTYYIEDPEIREYFETNFLDNWQERLLKSNDRLIRRMRNVKGFGRVNHASSEQVVITNLQNDARTDLLNEMTKAMKKKRGYKASKSAKATLEQIVRNDEEKAKKAEQELFAMIEKEEKLVKSKSKPKPKKKK